MRGRIGVITAAATLILASAGVVAQRPGLVNQRGGIRIEAALEPRQEVPALVSTARGSFSARLFLANGTLEYALTYNGLQGDVRQAHIHIAQPGVNGGIMVWLCGTTQNPGPAGTQVCPQDGTITGTITSADVLAVNLQGIEVGNFEDFARAVIQGSAYANVHTTQWPGGEIRGQLGAGRR
jgi:hypothetical protein